MNRKALILIILLLVLVGIGTYVMIFRIFPPPTSMDEAQTEAGTRNGVTETEADDRLTRLHSASVLSPTLLSDGTTVRSYEAATGHVLDSNLAGTETTRTTSNVDITNLRNIWWSPDNNVVVTLRDSADGPQWLLYNYGTGIAQPLDPSTSDVAFSPDSTRFAYILGNKTESVLYTASVTGNGVERIATIPDARPLVWWTTPDTLLVAQRPTGLSTSIVWRVSLTDNSVDMITIDDLYGTDFLPSPDGSRLLYSSATRPGDLTFLYIGDTAFQERSVFSSISLAQKCTWVDENTTIICAVPQDPEDLLVSRKNPLPDAYFRHEIRTTDTFVVLNTSSQRAVAEFTPDASVDAVNLIVPPTRDQIIFVNRNDNRLYRYTTPRGF